MCGVDEAGRGPLAGPVVAAACVVIPSLLQGAGPPLQGINDSKQVGEAERELLMPQLLACRGLAFGVAVVDHRVVDRINILAATMLAMTRAVASAREAALAQLAKASGARGAGGGGDGEQLRCVFVDGPNAPFRIAAAAASDAAGRDPDGGGKPLPDDGAAAVEFTCAPDGSEDGGLGALSSPPAPLALTSATPSSSSLSGPAERSGRYGRALQKRLGLIHTVQPVIGGDAKVFCIAAASIVAKVTRDRLMRRSDALWPNFGFALHKGYGTTSHFAAIHKLGASPIHRLTFAPLRTMFPALAEAARGGPLDAKAAAAAAAAAAGTKPVAGLDGGVARGGRKRARECS